MPASKKNAVVHENAGISFSLGSIQDTNKEARTLVSAGVSARATFLLSEELVQTGMQRPWTNEERSAQ